MDFNSSYPVLTALWLGVLTSISPCPLASNITALFYMAGGSGGARLNRVFFKALCYAVGRAAAYTFVAWLLTWGVLSVPAVANFLQTYLNQVLGPVLLIIGAVLTGWIRFPAIGLPKGDRLKGLADRAGTGMAGAGFLGLLFALSFCPVSAALFFGSLLPIAITRQSPVIMPVFYGLGTALPVVVIAILLSMGMDVTGRLFSTARVFEAWVTRLTAVVFFAVGGYYTWVFLISPMFPQL
jgi:cytochrome c biogenesis protein CcdA